MLLREILLSTANASEVELCRCKFISPLHCHLLYLQLVLGCPLTTLLASTSTVSPCVSLVALLRIPDGQAPNFSRVLPNHCQGCDSVTSVNHTVNVPERMQRIKFKCYQVPMSSEHRVTRLIGRGCNYAYTVQKYAVHDATCITKMLGALYPSLLIA